MAKNSLTFKHFIVKKKIVVEEERPNELKISFSL